MWIVDDVGEERASFRMSFRELHRLATIQKLDLVAKQVEQLQKKKQPRMVVALKLLCSNFYSVPCARSLGSSS